MFCYYLALCFFEAIGITVALAVTRAFVAPSSASRFSLHG